MSVASNWTKLKWPATRIFRYALSWNKGLTEWFIGRKKEDWRRVWRAMTSVVALVSRSSNTVIRRNEMRVDPKWRFDDNSPTVWEKIPFLYFMIHSSINSFTLNTHAINILNWNVNTLADSDRARSPARDRRCREGSRPNPVGIVNGTFSGHPWR